METAKKGTSKTVAFHLHAIHWHVYLKQRMGSDNVNDIAFMPSFGDYGGDGKLCASHVTRVCGLGPILNLVGGK